jgi:3-phenylpropionate/trans-cinnamate dioxygenase ferredoxin component
VTGACSAEAQPGFVETILRLSVIQVQKKENMMSFVDVAAVNEVPAGTMKPFSVNGKQILVSNVSGQYYALDNICTHAGGELSAGKLEGNMVICPRHGARFDLTSGQCLAGPKMGIFKPKIKNENAYEVKVEGNVIKVNL